LPDRLTGINPDKLIAAVHFGRDYLGQAIF